MSDIVDLYRQDEQRVLDRLADGELSDAETRELLGALDQETDAWRRCALAFVEARALRGDLLRGDLLRGDLLRGDLLRGDLRSLEIEQPIDIPASRPRPVGSFRKWPWTTGLALAASLVVTFSLGMLLGRDNGLFRRTPGTPPNLVNNDPAPAGNSLAGFGPLGTADGWRTVKLGVEDGSQGMRDIELPVRDMASIDPDWDNDESALSADDEQELQQSGHVIKRERELWPIDLKDGRRLVVPVEQVEVQYIGYQ